MIPYKRIKRELVKQGHIIDIYEDTVQLPDGRSAKWDFIMHKGAAAIIPVDSDGKILMVRQYRNAVDQYTLEIPAGGLNPGEDMKTCAIRECEEETGYRTESAYHLIDLNTTVAFCNEKIGIYYTHELTKTQQKLDEDEFVSVERYDLEELMQLILAGKIIDAKTIAALMAYKVKQSGEYNR